VTRLSAVALRAWAARGPAAASVLLALAFGLGVGWVPGFGGPGYEIALATGISMPSVVAVCAALDLRLAERAPLEALGRGFGIGLAAFAATALAALFHGARGGFCDPTAGLEIMALGPGVGLPLAGVWGWAASELARFVAHGRRRTVLAVVAALAGPIGGIALSLIRYYTSPIIFAYDPFAGYFSGTLYDTVLDFSTLGTYRLGSLATLVAVAALAAHLTRDDAGRARPRWLGRPLVAVLGAFALVASVCVTLAGAKLGHWGTRATIEAELGGRVDGERCVVVYDRAIDRPRVALFAAECEAHVSLVEAWWGARGPEKITAFLFASEGQKARLMGAAGTNIAKPWRAEVYVQDLDYPHRVIGHELMHVVAASHGRGPFRVAGDLAGYLPNPGLIEGVAVAASPKEDDLTPMEWAKAMKDLDLLPRLDSLFTLGFLGENSSMAYTVSGAFVGWVHDQHGSEVVRRWYGGEPLSGLTGHDLAALEASWHDALDQLVLGEAERSQAKARFDRPGFFARKCPRVVDECREKADSLSSSGDLEGALEQLARARTLEPQNPNLRLEEAGVWSDGPEWRRGGALYQEIVEDPSMPAFAKDRAKEALADQALASGDAQAAEALYADVIERTIDESKLRTLHVKRTAAREPALRPAIVTLLLGQPGEGSDRTAAAALLGVLDRERPDDGLPAYLLGRYFVDAERYPAALRELDRALARNLTVPRVRIEALRLKIVAATAVGACSEASEALLAYEREPGVRGARVDGSRRLVALCAAMPTASRGRLMGPFEGTSDEPRRNQVR
jgi:tetratricopeptide (TPR) repeat protein